MIAHHQLSPSAGDELPATEVASDQGQPLPEHAVTSDRALQLLATKFLNMSVGVSAVGVGGGPVLARMHAGGRSDARTSAGRTGPPRDPPPSPARVRELRRRFQGRKFLFPLLDQGPNNQFLQFRVALQKAHSLNRTLVLPIWLPHNPKFQHLHPGAPPTPSRDKRLDRIWYPFETAYEPGTVAQYVRTISLDDFRVVSGGRLEQCIGHPSAGWMEP